MMKLKKCLIVVICLVFGSSFFTGCFGPKRDSNTLTIKYYNGGYGKQWAIDLAEKFAAENDGIVVDLIADNGMLGTIYANLQDDRDLTDLYFSHDISWETYGMQGLIEPLDDLYEMEVEDGVKFKDRLIPEALATAKHNNHYYKVNWTQGAGGIVYNVKMFADYGWKVPETYQELVDVCAQIHSDGKVPFVWSGTGAYLWDYVVFEWWAQLAGIEKVNQLLTYDKTLGAEMFNPNTNWKEFNQAYKYWYDLICLNPQYSLEGSTGTTIEIAQTEFVTGKAAMMPNAHWLFNETKNSAMAGFEMAMINAPTLPDAKEGYEKINFMPGFGDSVILAKHSASKELAKKFLLFMAREENCKEFSTNVPGTSLAFKYDMGSVAVENKFAQSIAKILDENKSFHLYSSSPLAVLLGSNMISPWPNNTYYYKDSFLDTAIDPAEVGLSVYNFVKSNWKGWADYVGL